MAAKASAEAMRQKYGIFWLLEQYDPDKIVWPTGLQRLYGKTMELLKKLQRAEMGWISKKDSLGHNHADTMKPRPSEIISGKKIITKDGIRMTSPREIY